MTATFVEVLVQEMNEVYMTPCTWNTDMINISKGHPFIQLLPD